jgi:hypothetical protein
MKVSETFKNLLVSNPDIEKQELFDQLHWVKQVIGLLFGLAMGCLKCQGFLVIIGFLIVMGFSSLVYTWQVVKTEEFDSFDIVKEGFMVCFFAFMLTWTLSFTFV